MSIQLNSNSTWGQLISLQSEYITLITQKHDADKIQLQMLKLMAQKGWYKNQEKADLFLNHVPHGLNHKEYALIKDLFHKNSSLKNRTCDLRVCFKDQICKTHGGLLEYISEYFKGFFSFNNLRQSHQNLSNMLTHPSEITLHEINFPLKIKEVIEFVENDQWPVCQEPQPLNYWIDMLYTIRYLQVQSRSLIEYVEVALVEEILSLKKNQMPIKPKEWIHIYTQLLQLALSFNLNRLKLAFFHQIWSKSSRKEQNALAAATHKLIAREKENKQNCFELFTLFQKLLPEHPKNNYIAYKAPVPHEEKAIELYIFEDQAEILPILKYFGPHIQIIRLSSNVCQSPEIDLIAKKYLELCPQARLKIPPASTAIQLKILKTVHHLESLNLINPQDRLNISTLFELFKEVHTIETLYIYIDVVFRHDLEDLKKLFAILTNGPVRIKKLILRTKKDMSSYGQEFISYLSSQTSLKTLQLSFGLMNLKLFQNITKLITEGHLDEQKLLLDLSKKGIQEVVHLLNNHPELWNEETLSHYLNKGPLKPLKESCACDT